MNIYHELPIADIRVGPRFREISNDDVKALADSINTFGLLHAVVIDRNYNLLAGHRRLVAHRVLGRSSIYCRFIDEVDPLTAREIELEENIQREDLTWLQVDNLRVEIDRLKRLKYGSALPWRPTGGTKEGWSQRDTAASLGVDVAQVNRSISRVAAISAQPSIAEQPTAAAADREIDRLCDAIEVELNLRKRKRCAPQHLMLGDCCDLLAQLPAASVDLIVADPPYGHIIPTQDLRGAHRTPMEYDNDPVSAMATMRTAFKEMRRVLRPSGHCYVFFAIVYYREVRDLLEQSGFEPDPIPLIWCKSTHSTVDWDQRYAPSYEPFFFCTTKERKLAHKRINLFSYDHDEDRQHTAQKPLALIEELVSMSSAPGEVVLDPFMGSGTTCVAALRQGRKYIGIELDKQTFDAAQVRIMEAENEEISTDLDHVKSANND